MTVKDHKHIMVSHHKSTSSNSQLKMWATCLLIFMLSLSSQAQVYEMDWKEDALTLGLGTGLTILGHQLLTDAEKASLADINRLTTADINPLDRWAAGNSSQRAKAASDYLLYASATLPFLTYFSVHNRGQEWKVGVMAFETFLITNGTTNIIKALAKRYRPFNYDPAVSLDQKLNDSSRLSFLSGHASNTAALAFFSAKIISDLHPEINKYLVWIPAASIPAVIGTLRVLAGKHFPTDVISGYALGAVVGYMIPHLHKKRDMKLTVGAGTVGLTYTF